jgi:hypothetical protein
MNKKTGEFSAMDVKRPVGVKEPSWPKCPRTNSSIEGRFVCVECKRDLPNTEIGRREGNKHNNAICKTCVAKAIKKMHRDPKKVEAGHKATTKAYKVGRLPKWMFS